MTAFLIMLMAKFYLVRIFILLLMIMFMIVIMVMVMLVLMIMFVIMFVNVLLIMSMSAFSLFMIMIVLICYRSCDIFLKRSLSFFNLSILDYNFYLMLMDLLTLSLFFVAMLFILIIDQALNIFAYYL
jgi:hypothetical protein